MEIGAAPGCLQLIPRQPGRKIPSPTTSYFSIVRCNALGGSSGEMKPPKSQDLRMFILGMGFVGQYFAADLKKKGWAVSGTCTSTAKKMNLQHMGYDAYVFNANEPEVEVLDVMKCHTHLLVSIPPVADVGDPMLQHENLLKNRLKDGSLQWLSYLSSTRVYGDSGGAWVDEDYPIVPTNELARSRLAAEEGWSRLGHDLDIDVQIFRLGGIYGPGRSAIDTIIKKEPLSLSQRVRSSRRFTSRIHVSDICQALHASIKKPSNRIYNLVDDVPAPRTEVFTFGQNLVRKKWPNHGKESTPPETAESTIPEAGSREEKRVSNNRMKLELGVKLVHPSYKSGLQDIINHMDDDPYSSNFSSGQKQK